MSTVKQKKVAKALVENLSTDKPLPIGQVLKSVGYGTGLQTQPKRVLESEGVLQELAILGFDEQTAKGVVSEILTDETNEPKDRLKAAEMVFKVHGTFAPEKSININAQFNLENKEEVEAIASKVLEQMRNDEIV